MSEPASLDLITDSEESSGDCRFDPQNHLMKISRHVDWRRAEGVIGLRKGKKNYLMRYLPRCEGELINKLTRDVSGSLFPGQSSHL